MSGLELVLGFGGAVRCVRGVLLAHSREQGVFVDFLLLHRSLDITEIVRLSLGGLVRLLGPVRRLAPLDQFHRLRPVDLLGLRLTAPVLPPDRLRLVLAEIHKECLLLWRRIDVFHPREHA